MYTCIPGTRRRVNLLSQGNHIWYTSCNQSYHLIELTVICYHSPRPSVFCRGQMGELNWDVVEVSTTASFPNLVFIVTDTPGPHSFWDWPRMTICKFTMPRTVVQGHCTIGRMWIDYTSTYYVTQPLVTKTFQISCILLFSNFLIFHVFFHCF